MIAAIDREPILVCSVLIGIILLILLLAGMCVWVGRLFENWRRRKDNVMSYESGRLSDSSYLAQNSSLFSRDKFLLKNQGGFFRRSHDHDILDPDTSELIGTAKDESPASWSYRSPKTVNIYAREGGPRLLSIHRPAKRLLSKFPDARVVTGDGQTLGYIRHYKWKGEVEVLDASGRMAAREDRKYEGKVSFFDTKGPVTKLITGDGREIGRENNTSSALAQGGTLILINQQAEVSPAERAMMLAVWLAAGIVFDEPDVSTNSGGE